MKVTPTPGAKQGTRGPTPHTHTAATINSRARDLPPPHTTSPPSPTQPLTCSHSTEQLPLDRGPLLHIGDHPVLNLLQAKQGTTLFQLTQ